MNLYFIIYKIIFEGNFINRLDFNDLLRCKIKVNSKELIEIEVNKLKLFSKMLNIIFLNKNFFFKVIRK